MGVSSGSSLFAKVPVKEFPVFKGLDISFLVFANRLSELHLLTNRHVISKPRLTSSETMVGT